MEMILEMLAPVMGNEPKTIRFYRLIKIRDYLRWPVQAMPKWAAQGSLIISPTCAIYTAWVAAAAS